MVLYITSRSEKAGKTLLAAGLAKYWLEKGRKIGYFKLLRPDVQGAVSDKDAAFMQKVLNLTETMEALCPAISNQSTEGGKIRSTFETGFQDKDLVLIEGLSLKLSENIIRELATRILIVHDYADSLKEAIAEYNNIRPNLLGVIVNKVPVNKLDLCTKQFRTELDASGINLLGVIPEERILTSPSVADIADMIQGKILNNEENVQELVENLMVGSSTFERGPAYYTRKNNKAVILWGERQGFRKAVLSNLQLAALQTSTRCIIISHNGGPIPSVAQKAGEKGTPLISAPGTVPDLIKTIENSINKIKFNQEKKMTPLLEILRKNLDWVILEKNLNTTA